MHLNQGILLQTDVCGRPRYLTLLYNSWQLRTVAERNRRSCRVSGLLLTRTDTLPRCLLSCTPGSSPKWVWPKSVLSSVPGTFSMPLLSVPKTCAKGLLPLVMSSQETSIWVPRRRLPLLALHDEHHMSIGVALGLCFGGMLMPWGRGLRQKTSIAARADEGHPGHGCSTVLHLNCTET